jgi:Rrf2 family transcriptional regulator, cysteine metabolism repressor
MKLSTRGRYGARALMELAKTYGEGPLSLKAISSQQKIPLKYLEQIAMALKEAHLIKSVRGPAGGYELCRHPSDIRLLEIVETLEGSLSFVRCVQEPEVCDRAGTCAFNDLWKHVAAETAKVLHSFSLADMLELDSAKKNSPLPCFDP